MKEIEELNLPDDVRYTEEHEWAKVHGEKIRMGVTDYAQDQLGDIVFVELPEVGSTYRKGEVYATLESVKAVAEVYIPISGEIVGVNANLGEAPALVNTAPYTDGWIADVKPDDPSEMDGLMTAEAYREMIKGMTE